ncbi:MAG: hypothetical protein GXO12_02645 [Epsilonproteobacteria bacterium]|nr:hypothetical protein [Campylobacterota bacterium]
MNSLLLINNGENIADNTAAKNAKNTVQKEQDSDIKFDDFLSLILNSAKNQSEILDIQSPNIKTDSDKISLQKSDLSKNLDELSLDDLLNFVSFLKSNGMQGNFPTDKTKINSILKDEQAVHDFKSIKNLDDLLKTAKKYNIQIKDFSISKIDEKNIKNSDTFKNILTQNQNNTSNLTTLSNITTKNTKTLQVSTSDNKISDQSPLKNLMQDNSPSQAKTNPKDNIQNSIKIADKAPYQAKEVKTLNSAEENKKDRKITPKNEIKGISSADTSEVFDKNSVFTKEQKTKIIAPKSDMQKEKQDTKKEMPSIDTHKNSTISKDNGITTVHQTHIKHTQTNPVMNKSIDARQTIERFTNDLQEQINNYKPPFTRVKMTLHPENLGEVDVSMVSRGNSLQITVSSNNNTMAIFTQNQAEFKNSLVNMGFTNLNMNFNTNGNGSNKHENRSQKNSKNFENMEENEVDGIDFIDITIPRYI